MKKNWKYMSLLAVSLFTVASFAPSGTVLADDDDDYEEAYEMDDDWDDWGDDDDWAPGSTPSYTPSAPAYSDDDWDDDDFSESYEADDDWGDWDDDRDDFPVQSQTPVTTPGPSQTGEPEIGADDRDDQDDGDDHEDRREVPENDDSRDDREDFWDDIDDEGARAQDPDFREDRELPEKYDDDWDDEKYEYYDAWDDEDDKYREDEDDDPSQGYKVGEDSPTGQKVTALHLNTNQSVPTLARENKDNEEERYQQARNAENQNKVSVEGADQPQTLKANDKTVSNFNSGKYIDVDLLNEEFNKLLNADREAAGLEPVQYGKHLQKGTDTRANNLASINDIRVDNQAHVRLDGSPYYEDFSYLGEGKNGIGENTAMQSYSGNPYELTSEKALAEKFYEQWKASPSHYENMMSPDYKYSTISVKMGDGEGKNGNSLIAVQNMDVNP